MDKQQQLVTRPTVLKIVLQNGYRIRLEPSDSYPGAWELQLGEFAVYVHVTAEQIIALGAAMQVADAEAGRS